MRALSAFWASFDARFEPRGVERFWRLLGAALLLLVLHEFLNEQWAVHAGRLCPRRLLALTPLYPPAVLLAEWTALALCGASLLAGRFRAGAARLGACVLVVSLTQRFMNQKAMLLCALACAAIAPPDPAEPDFESRPRPNLALLLWHTAVVYGFSAYSKTRLDFLNGEALIQVLALAAQIPGGALAKPAGEFLRSAPPVAAALSCAVVLAEASLPALLLRKPKTGFALAALLHAGFAVLVPGIWAFTAVMLACAALFTARRP